ncbi:DUF7118 family protein [Halococcoides cellulosivorans]|uniref:Uncharacterized protein n=1 Tax=Halococcoides cellulosivorans TaxID=1679096 RepID=A0A2R4X437_9EURY|nr:hypothetical protein [Halococcoides cellulosivorans]AWB28549.1 hypothetical protein HARCEL1_13090 [Halococcoides cellulosivorans]
MVDPGRSPQLARAAGLIASLDRAVADHEAAQERIRAADGDLQALAAAHQEVTALLDQYDETAVGDADFESYLTFQDELATFFEDLDDDLPEREAFESVDERLHQRRLTESDFEAARETLAGVADRVAVLDERRDAAERIRRRRFAIERAIEDLRERVEACAALEAHADADLSADVARLARPITDYDRRIEADFATFRRTASAREFLDWLDDCRWYPLVDLDPPPADLQRYVDRTPVGTEPLGTLREYADYSHSKLDHYVDDPGALKRAVGPHTGYLRRLDAGPLTVGWPPPEADDLRYRTRELLAVVDRIADDATVAALQRVRALAFSDDYSRRREAAVARVALDPTDRRRLQWGLVQRERVAAEQAIDRLQSALSDAPAP